MKSSLCPLAVVADVHLGNRREHGGKYSGGLNDRGRLSIEALRGSMLTAVKEGAQVFVIAGDLFDSRRPEPAIIAAARQVLASEEFNDLSVLIVPGNHDMLDATADDGNTACAPLYREATVVGERAVFSFRDFNLLCVPFQSKQPMSSYLDEVLSSTKTAPILVCHVGVYDDESPPWCRSAPDAIHADHLLRLMEAADIKHAFVGNYHQHKVWLRDGRSIVQVGALCPGTFGDAGEFPLVGGMALFNPKSEQLDMREAYGPRFLKAPPAKADDRNQYYLRVSDGADVPEATNVVVEIDEEAAVLPQSAAELPQVADAETALAEYIAAMPLDPDVTREAVSETVMRCWERSSAA